MPLTTYWLVLIMPLTTYWLVLIMSLTTYWLVLIMPLTTYWLVLRWWVMIIKVMFINQLESTCMLP